VPKHEGVLLIFMNCVLLSTFVGGYTDCKNMHGVNHIKDSGKLLALFLPSQVKVTVNNVERQVTECVSVCQCACDCFSQLLLVH
jgi:hypothetical protein